MERKTGSVVLPDDEFFAGRGHAEFHHRDDKAEAVYAGLSRIERFQLLFGPVKVGVVDWGKWDPPDDPEEAIQTGPRTRPLYLFSHGKHKSLAYANGFPGDNERLECHCGYKHYFPSSRGPSIRNFIALAISISRRKRPPMKVTDASAK